MRDWRSGIVTVTVRDQRNREHDPILGVVPIRLSEILATSSQVTKWYPLDGGIGFGRIRISVLFRSVETRLPPNMLGWDVGTFEFLSDQIVATGWSKNTKLKLPNWRKRWEDPPQPLPQEQRVGWCLLGCFRSQQPLSAIASQTSLPVTCDF